MGQDRKGGVMVITSKVQLVDYMRKQLATNDKQAKKALLFLFDRQTEDEQKFEAVKVNNGVGFKDCDAKFLSSLAKQLREKNYLTDKQMACLKKSIQKYAGQLIKSSLSRGLIKKENGVYSW